MQKIAEVIKTKKLTKDHRNKFEFQAYGNRLADEFADNKHRALYIKLAKTVDRNLLEQAREFIMANKNLTDKGKLFMWKLTELRNRN